MRAERDGLQEMNRRSSEANDRMDAIKGSLLERAETAEARGRELQAKRDMASAERSRALEQLAVLTTEKRGLEDANDRLSAQARHPIYSARLAILFIAHAQRPPLGAGTAPLLLIARASRHSIHSARLAPFYL